MQPNKNQYSLKRIQPTSYVFSKDRQLGKGTFGEVFLGFDQKNKIPVAIKTISYTKLSQSHINQQTIAQKLAGQLGNMQLARSQRLVKLISPHQSSKNMYVVVQYCNEGSLRDYLRNKRNLSECQAMSFFKDILEGLKCLHEKRIVHRDMKPANLLLHNHRIKIGDLGFSRSIQVHQQILTSIVGTPLYMSPQILSNTTYTQKTDIWSLGIILFQMLIGQAPWRVNNMQQIKQKVRHRPQFPKNTTISQETKQLIMSMLAYEQKNRIGWQQLFKNYLNSSNGESQMQQQSLLMRKVYQVHEHYTCSLSIQSQHHIHGILQKNNRKYTQFWVNCNSAKQFFQKSKENKKQQQYMQSVINAYVQARNCIAFLMRLFMQCYQNCQQLNSHLVYTAMFMILKFCITSTQQLYASELMVKVEGNNSEQNNDKTKVFLNSVYFSNFKQLLNIDLQLLKSLYELYYLEVFIPKLKQISQTDPGAVSIIQRDLKPFFSSESAALKFTQFWMKTQNRKLFNAFKEVDQLPSKWILIPRMIYEYEKSIKSNMSIFVNKGERSDMWKKIQNWTHQQSWKTKLKQIKNYQIQTITTFLNRQLKLRSFDIVGMNFGSNDTHL